MTRNRDSLLRRSGCRACGEPLDMTYALMCTKCVVGGVPIPPHGEGKGHVKMTIEDLREAVDDNAIRCGARAMFYESRDTIDEIGWLHADSDVWAVLKAVFVDA